MSDTSVSVYDTLSLSVSSGMDSSLIWLYLWSFDNGMTFDTTSGSIYLKFWEPADTGLNIILVKTLTRDILESPVDTISVTIILNAPSVRIQNSDTTTAAWDTIRVCAHAADPNGFIQAYVWSIGSNASPDTTTDSCHSFTCRGPDTTLVNVTAIDDDGLTDTQSMRIKFGLPPSTPMVTLPADTVVQKTPDSSFIKGNINFSFSSTDPDLPVDTLLYTLSLGRNPDSLVHQYTGPLTSFTAQNLDTGDYYWNLTARDAYKNSASASGTFSSILQSDICFIGHSIALGLGAPAEYGGFRKSVLDELRMNTGKHRRFNAVGPINRHWLANEDDDSCLAVSGATSRDILDSLNLHPETNADIWVLMIGVNGDIFGYWERYYTPSLIDAIHRRNPLSYLYVLNGLPLPDSLASYKIDKVYDFNRMLDSIVTLRRSYGWNIRLVDAFSAMAPDSVFNSDLFSDLLHPNINGYDVLAEEILKVMELDR